VRLGQPAELRLDALPGTTFAGKVARVDPVVKRDLKGARTLTVEVEVAGVEAARSAGLKPGMSANVEIIVAEKQGVLAVPSNVIVGRGVSRFVYVVESDGQGRRARRRPVEVGLSNWERSEISSGVSVGALLVSSLNEKGLDDGVAVQPVESKGP
jgi:HlyD family secretion protein